MIQEIRIKNFLSFKKEVVFSFEATSDKSLEDYYVYEPTPRVRLLKLVMVYGANASGKSNLIKAFDFIKKIVFNTVENKEEEIDFQAFAFDKSKRGKPGHLELVFYVGDVKHIYVIELDEENIYKENLSFYPGTQPATIFNRFYEKQTNTSIIEFGTKLKISNTARESIELKTLKNSSVFSAYSQVNVAVTEIDRVYDWFKMQFMASINPYTHLTKYSDKHIKKDKKLKEFALKFISKADFNITDILFDREIKHVSDDFIKGLERIPIPENEKERIRKEKVIYFDKTIFEHKILHGNNEEYYQLDEEYQSQGTMRFYGLTAPFFHTIKNNAFLSIDEIGSALHPLLVIHFIREFLEHSKSAQLLITTHNMSLLNEKDILRRDAIWITEKGEDGSTELSSVADFTEFRKELSYFNYYKQGKFGGVPNID